MYKNVNGKRIEMTQEEIEAFELSRQPSLEQIKQKLINVRKQYLQDTDWYIAREIDEPNSYPQEIKNKRILARQEINEIAITTRETINNYTMEF